MGSADIIAAGAVVSRRGGDVLLVHRPKYDDWSFPKGKLDPGEHIVNAAVREVAEETGLDIRLGPPLSTQRYMVQNNGMPKAKDVYYWAARVVGGDDVSTYHPNDEIDQVAWLSIPEARARLTQDYDRETLTELSAFRKPTYPLMILRHSRAQPRGSWLGEDRDRPLSSEGELQADELVPLLGAYGIERLVSSSSRRCWGTVAPYADVADLDIELADDLSEEEASGPAVSAHLERLLSSKRPAVLCTHRPVLPLVFDALGLEERALEPGAFCVVHHRRGKVVAVEQHDVDFR